MAAGARITDEVEHHRRSGDLRGAVRIVRSRQPERLRWRAAVASMTKEAGSMHGIERMRVEEPIREVILELPDRILRRESVLDARRFGVDLDRGEVLPIRSRWDLKRTAFLTGVDHELLGRYMNLPADFATPIDTAGAVVIARGLANAYKLRADKLLQRIPNQPHRLRKHERYMRERVDHELDIARRWAALSRTLAQGSR